MEKLEESLRGFCVYMESELALIEISRMQRKAMEYPYELLAQEALKGDHELDKLETVEIEIPSV